MKKPTAAAAKTLIESELWAWLMERADELRYMDWKGGIDISTMDSYVDKALRILSDE